MSCGGGEIFVINLHSLQKFGEREFDMSGENKNTEKNRKSVAVSVVLLALSAVMLIWLGKQIWDTRSLSKTLSQTAAVAEETATPEPEPETEREESELPIVSSPEPKTEE